MSNVAITNVCVNISRLMEVPHFIAARAITVQIILGAIIIFIAFVTMSPANNASSSSELHSTPTFVKHPLLFISLFF